MYVGVNLKMVSPFHFKEQDLAILQQLRGLESRDHLPDNFVIFDYNSFSNEVGMIDSFFACEFLSENFHVVIVTECNGLKVSFKHVVAENCTVIPAVPARMLRNVAHPCDHIATVVMAHLTKSHDRRAYYCLSADENFPINTDMIDLIGDEFIYCCVIKSIKDFLNLEKWFQKFDDPVKMRLYCLFQNSVPRDDSDPENCGKIMFFNYGDKFGSQIEVQTLWKELKMFADNYDPYPLHVSVTTSFPIRREKCEVSCH